MLILLRSCFLLIIGAAALIPREKLFSKSINALSISPDGKYVGFIGQDSNRTNNVFIRKHSDDQKRQVTFEKRDVQGFQWTGVENVILFISDKNGDENTMIFKKNISENSPVQERTVVYQKDKVMALIVSNNKKENYVLIGANDENPKYYNIYKFNLLTNELTRILTNTRFSWVYTDNDMRIRLAKEDQPDGSKVFYRVSSNANNTAITSDLNHWEKYLRVLPEDTAITKIKAFDATNENIYWIWGENSDLGNLIISSIKEFSISQIIYTPVKAQIFNTLFHPEESTLLAVSEYYHKPQFVAINDTISKDLEYLKNLRPDGALQILSLTPNMQTWLITYLSSENPNEVFVYDRSKQTAEFLMNLNPELEGYSLSKKIGFEFTARDGFSIQAYLSLPPQVALKRSREVANEDSVFADQGMIPSKPQKMVLLVHGGPQWRDEYGFKTMEAFLTDRGYAVLQVNFRGSTGFGKNLTNAGNGEWSRKMHTDLLDAVEFTISKGIANRSEVAIMGVSYGGYAALVGLTFTPDYFACGVDIVGPANLVTLMKSLPPYWNHQQTYSMTGGDPNTGEGRKELEARSPVFLAEQVKKPLIIMQGANDPRVPQHESDQFVNVLKNHSIPFTYVLYPDEGHVFSRTPNNLAKFGFVETFLHDCLGGQYQSFTIGQYDESAIVSSHR